VTDALGLAAALVALAVAAFVASIRIGILVGRRLDGALEARAAAGLVEADTMPLTPESADQVPQQGGDSGREEYCGE
jgi:hypothetical protein